MSEYQIESVIKEDREPVIQGKTFHSYVLGLKGHEGQVQLLQNPSTPPPSGTIEGTIEPGKPKQDGGKWPDRLKRTKQFSGQPFTSNPNREKHIVRQHSQEMALRYVEIYNDASPLEAGLDGLKELIDWFEADASSEPPTEPSKPKRDGAPVIPLDRAKSILEAAQIAGLAQGVYLQPALAAKLVDVGVQTGKIGHLSVDQAEDVEAFIHREEEGVAQV